MTIDVTGNLTPDTDDNLTPAEAIAAIYVGYFNRAPDPAGLEYWLGRYNEFLDGDADGDAGLSLSGIANSFSVQPETTAIYSFFSAPTLADAQAFITQVYLNLFNRTPDTDGLNYWTGQLIAAQASNDDDLNVGQIIIQIISGAQNDANGQDKTVVLNKIEAGLDFASDLTDAGFVPDDINDLDGGLAAAKEVLNGVTEDAASVDAAALETDAYVSSLQNQAPVAADDTSTVAEDAVLSDTVAANDADPDGDALTYTLTSDVSNGSLSFNADGSYTYTPGADFNGTDSFTYTVTDPEGETDTATATITVTPVDDAPVPNDTATNATEDAAIVSGTLTAADIDSGNFTFAVVGATPAGLNVNNDGTFTFDPSVAAYQSLAEGATQTLNVPFSVTSEGNSGQGTLTITITGENDAPVATASVATVAEDGSVTITPAASDVDAGDTAAFAIVTQAGNGTVVDNGNGTFTYSPNPDFNGVDSFTYSVTDSEGATDTATISVAVTPIDDAPEADNSVVDATEGGAVIAGSVTATDIDSANIVYSVQGTAPAGLSFNNDGTFTFDPSNPAYDALDAGDTETLTVTFQASASGQTDTATLTINLTGTNDAPQANAVVASVLEDGSVTVAPTSSDADADDTAAFSVASQPSNGTVVDNGNGTFTYTPNPNFNGVDTFTYTVTDSAGAADTATVSVTVGAVNDAPEAQDVSAAGVEDGTVEGLALATDIDGDDLTYTVVDGDGPANGDVTMNPDGTFTYVPDANFFGTDTFTYTVSDGTTTDTGVVTLTIAPVSDVLTTGVDVIDGAAADDVVVGNESTLNAGDQITGGEGDDTVVINVQVTGPNAPSFAGFEADVETFRVTVEGNGTGGTTGSSTATVTPVTSFDMSSSEITGNTVEVVNSNGGVAFLLNNLNGDGPDADTRGNADDNNDGLPDGQFDAKIENVTSTGGATFTFRPGQVTSSNDEANIFVTNTDNNAHVGYINLLNNASAIGNSAFGTTVNANDQTASGIDVVDLYTVDRVTGESSALPVFIDDLNTPGANTLNIDTDVTLTIGDSTPGAGNVAVNVNTSPFTASNITGFENAISNSITSVVASGAGAVALWLGTGTGIGGTGVNASMSENNDTVLGGSNNDVISGNNGNDAIDGAGGNDILNGGEGRDTVIGGSGNDTTDGGAGNDIMDGGAGSDSQTGGDGNDVIDTGEGAGVEFVDAGADNDSVFTDGKFLTGRPTGTGSIANVDRLDGGDDIDTLFIQNAGGATGDIDGLNDVQAFETIFLQNGLFNFTIGNNSVFEADHDTRVSNGGADGFTTIDGTGSTQSVTVNASTLDEAIELIGGDANDLLIGGRGDDTIEGDGDSSAGTFGVSGGNDTLLGGDGDDTFVTSINELDGGDVIDGDDDNDTILIDSDDSRSGINVVGAAAALNINTVIGTLNAGVSDIENIVIEDTNAGDQGDVVLAFNGFTNASNTSVFHDGIAAGSDTPRVNIDGSALDAGESLVIAMAGNGVNTDIQVTGGAGNDFFAMGALLNDPGVGQPGDIIDGGDGFDEVHITQVAPGDFAGVSNIECIRITNAVQGQVFNFGADAEAAFAPGVTPLIKLDAGVPDITVNTTAFAGGVRILDNNSDNTFNTSNTGDDTIVLAGGTDVVNSAGGNDVVEVSGTDLDATDVLNLGAGNDTVELDNSANTVTAVSNLRTNSTVENYVITSGGDTGIDPNTNNNTLTFVDAANAGNIVSSLTQINIDSTALTDDEDSFTVTLAASLTDAEFAFTHTGGEEDDNFVKLNQGTQNNITFFGNDGNDMLSTFASDANASPVLFAGGLGFDSAKSLGGFFTDDAFAFMTSVEQFTVDTTNAAPGTSLQGLLGVAANNAGITDIDGTNNSDNVTTDNQFTNDLDVTIGTGNDVFNFGASSSRVTLTANAAAITAGDFLTGGSGSQDLLFINADNGVADLSNTRGFENIEFNEVGDNDVGVNITNNTFTGTGGLITIDGTDMDDNGDDVLVEASTVTNGRFDITTGAGEDTVNTGTGSDTIDTGSDDDEVSSGGGNDDVTLGEGNDTASLGAGNDTATGDQGNDEIDGGSGNDDIDGGSGNDIIIGGLGADELTGGTGADAFRYANVNESFALSRDTITDFDQFTDCIEIESQLIFDALAARAAADPNDTITPNAGLNVGLGTSTVGFNNAGEIIEGVTNNGPGFAATFSDAIGAISQTANDGKADYILERNADGQGTSKLWIDVNDDGDLNGLDVQIFLPGVNTLSSTFSIKMVDTILDPLSSQTESFSEVRLLDDIVNSDFDGVAGTENGDPTQPQGVANDTIIEGQLDIVDTSDGGAVTYALAFGQTTFGQFGTLSLNGVTGAYTYSVGATQAQRDAIEALDDGESPTDVFNLIGSDSSGNTQAVTITVTANGADDNPDDDTTGTTTFTFTEQDVYSAGDEVSGDIDASDVDGDTVIFDVDGNNSVSTITPSVTLVGTFGTLTMNEATGVFDYVPGATAAQLAAIDALAEGQTASDTFTVDIFDGDDDGEVTRDIVATFTGVNDAPVLSVVDTAEGTLVENDPTPVVDGTLNVVDIDDDDIVGLTVTALPTISGTGAAAAAVAGFDGSSVDLSISTGAAAANAPAGTDFDWEFNGLKEEFDFLDDGEVLTLTYTVTADDGNSGTDTQTITIKIEGTNDAPTIGVVDAGDDNAIALIEDVPAKVITNSLTVEDLDVSDSIVDVTVTQLADGGTYDGPPIPGTDMMVSTILLDGGDADPGAMANLNWAFDPGAEAFDALPAGEQLILNYLITVTDNDGLTATETVSVAITGTNDVPVIVAPFDNVGEVTELVDGDIDETFAFLGDSGTITYTDADKTDSHTTSASGLTVIASNAEWEGLKDAVIDTPVGFFNAFHNDGADTINWTYDVFDGDIEFLGEDDFLSMTSTITIDDGNGGTTTETVTITVNGSNDSVDFITDTDTATVTEIVDGKVDEGKALLTDTGTLIFEDFDLGDTHSFTVTPQAGFLGTLTAAEAAGTAAHDFGDGRGVMDWAFEVSDADVEFIGAGETVKQTATITVTDEFGLTDTAVITVTINGENDAPEFAKTSSTTTVTEIVDNGPGETTSTLTSTGTVGFEDLDVTDGHTVAFTTSGGFLGTFQIDNLNGHGGTTLADVTNTGSVDWSFSVLDGDIEFLAEGQTLTQTATITITDDEAATDTTVVTITLTGSNDAPEFSIGAKDDVSEKVVETDLPLSATGTVTITDIDLMDQVTVEPTSVVANGSYLPNGAGNGSTPTDAQLLAMLDITGGVGPDDVFEADPAGDTVGWSWDSDSAEAVKEGVTDTAFDYLGNNESLVLTYTLTGTDDAKATDTQDVTITIFGTNDENTLDFVKGGTGTKSATLTVKEDSIDTTTTTFTFTAADVDDNDELTLSTEGVEILVNGVIYAGPSMLPTEAELLAALDVYNTKDGSGDTKIDDNREAGNVTAEWNNNGTLKTTDWDFLGANDTATITYTIKVDDLQGATSTQSITIKIDGENDNPFLVVDSISADPGAPNSLDTNEFSFTLDDVDDGAQLRLTVDIPESGASEDDLGDINVGTTQTISLSNSINGTDPNTLIELIGEDEEGGQTETDSNGDPLPDANAFIHLFLGDGDGGGDDDTFNLTVGGETVIIAQGGDGNDDFVLSGTNTPDSADVYLFAGTDDAFGDDNYIFTEQSAFGANIFIGDWEVDFDDQQIQFDIAAVQSGTSQIKAGDVIGSATIQLMTTGVTIPANATTPFTVPVTKKATGTASFTTTDTGMTFFQDLFGFKTGTAIATGTASTTQSIVGPTTVTLPATANATVTGVGGSTATLNVLTFGGGFATLTFANANVALTNSMIFDADTTTFTNLSSLQSAFIGNSIAKSGTAAAFGLVSNGNGSGVLHAFAIKDLDSDGKVDTGEITGTVTIATIMGVLDVDGGDIAFI
ncbi:MAG: Ig-like domain-containing protein [Pseudomonadota bacterium]